MDDHQRRCRGDEEPPHSLTKAFEAGTSAAQWKAATRASIRGRRTPSLIDDDGAEELRQRSPSSRLAVEDGAIS